MSLYILLETACILRRRGRGGEGGSEEERREGMEGGSEGGVRRWEVMEGGEEGRRE